MMRFCTLALVSRINASNTPCICLDPAFIKFSRRKRRHPLPEQPTALHTRARERMKSEVSYLNGYALWD